MCIIIDTNLYGEFGKDYMKPLRQWIEKRGGKIVYSLAGDIGRELSNNKKMRRRLEDYRRIGKAKFVPKKEVEKEKKVVDGLDLRSDDPYIIALARVSKTRLLTSEDSALRKDFTNRKIIRGGKIYKAREHDEHAHLLRDRCP